MILFWKTPADYVDAATNTEINVCDITTQTEPDKLAVAGRMTTSC